MPHEAQSPEFGGLINAITEHRICARRDQEIASPMDVGQEDGQASI